METILLIFFASFKFFYLTVFVFYYPTYLISVLLCLIYQLFQSFKFQHFFKLLEINIRLFPYLPTTQECNLFKIYYHWVDFINIFFDFFYLFLLLNFIFLIKFDGNYSKFINLENFNHSFN